MTLADFIALLPEFTDLSQARFDMALAVAESEISEGVFKEKYTTALAYLTAHYIALNEPERAAGAKVVSEREGDFSLSYERTDCDLDQTQYGKAFKAIRKKVVGVLGGIA